MSLLSTIKGLFKSRYPSVSAEELKQMMKAHKDLQIIDVRSKSEFSEGTIKGFRHFNLMDASFRSRISRLDKSKHYVVYCRSGGRSRSACNIFVNEGFENIYNLRGGIMGWKNQ